MVTTVDRHHDAYIVEALDAGEESGKRHWYTHDKRFDIDLTRSNWLKKPYVDARHEDGYWRETV